MPFVLCDRCCLVEPVHNRCPMAAQLRGPPLSRITSIRGPLPSPLGPSSDVSDIKGVRSVPPCKERSQFKVRYGACGVDASVAEPTFLPSTEQQRAMNAVLAGRNLFLTSCAGTGKSATLRQLRGSLEASHGSKSVAVTDMTGHAATIVGGITLQSLLKSGTLNNFRDLEVMLTDEKVGHMYLAVVRLCV
ncbi:hypothetical protein Vretifemale_5150 [Volvox reticuliferus]|uniref:DNA helicase n=1 Tax=Volvox reticuliferus TaxID=1737510 RepID=A0A8J4FI35_9CHLO|nr:hypothetical protein Vretifemale_5150 [Volvox reticuliferus]